MQTFENEKFKIELHRYTDPDRSSLSRRAAIFKGKPDRSNKKRPLQFVQFGHLSIFRGESVSVEFTTKKPIYDHLVTYTTIAGRYCAGLRANEALEVEAGDLQEQAERILAEYRAAVAGVDPETSDPVQKKRLENARDIAPMSVKVNYELEMNFLTLIHIFKDRKWIAGFQKETGEVIEQLWRIVSSQDPQLWSVIEEYHGAHVHRWTNALHQIRGFDLNDHLQGVERQPVTWNELKEAVDRQWDPWDNPTLEEIVDRLYCRMPKVW